MDQNFYDEALLYSIEKEKLSFLNHLLELIFFLLWTGYGLSLLESRTSFVGGEIFCVLFAMSFIAIQYLLDLPLEIYKTFVLDRRFGFSKITFALFAKDQLKSLFLFILLGTPILYAASYLLNNLQHWWLWLFGLLFLVVVAANFLYPTFIAPMFHRFIPLEEGELKTKVERLLNDAGFESSGLFKIDASTRDTRLNAYFAGFGKSKRVALYDTLIQKLSVDEILAVLAHELGHFKHRDVYKTLFATSAMLFGFCALFGNLPQEVFTSAGIQPSGGGIIVMFLLLSGPLAFFIMPLIAAMSKSNEFGADEYAAKTVGAENIGSALKKLSGENRSFPKAHTLQKFFYHTHPMVPQRLERLGL